MSSVRSVALIRFIIFVSTTLALLFLVISTSTNHWYVQENVNSKNESTEVNGGIFGKCIHLRKNESHSYKCFKQTADGSMIAVQVFLIAGIVGFVVILMYILLTGFLQGINFKVLSLLLLLTAFSVMIGVSIFTGEYSRNGERIKFRWSFYLGWLSFIFTVNAGVLSCFGNVSYQKI